MIGRPMFNPWLRRVAVLLAVGVVGLGLSGCSSRTSDAATVTYHDNAGDHTAHITRADLDNELQALLSNNLFTKELKASGIFPNVGGKVTTDTQLSTRWLTTLIRQTVVDAEINNGKITVTPTDTAQATQDETTTFTQPVLAAFSKSFTTKLIHRDAQLFAVYRYYQTCPSGRFVSHILVKTKAQADAALAVIRSGEKFSDIAKTRSTDTTSGKVGGALGCLTPKEFVTEFQSAAETAPLGVVTDPVKTQFGYHLILVRAWSPATDTSYGQALTQAASAVLSARLRDLKVWVNPRYGTWSAAKDAQGNTNFSVIPPAAPQVRTCREATPACAPATTSTSTTTTAPPAG
jgi:hypothetical protein